MSRAFGAWSLDTKLQTPLMPPSEDLMLQQQLSGDDITYQSQSSPPTRWELPSSEHAESMVQQPPGIPSDLGVDEYRQDLQDTGDYRLDYHDSEYWTERQVPEYDEEWCDTGYSGYQHDNLLSYGGTSIQNTNMHNEAQGVHGKVHDMYGGDRHFDSDELDNTEYLQNLPTAAECAEMAVSAVKNLSMLHSESSLNGSCTNRIESCTLLLPQQQNEGQRGGQHDGYEEGVPLEEEKGRIMVRSPHSGSDSSPEGLSEQDASPTPSEASSQGMHAYL